MNTIQLIFSICIIAIYTWWEKNLFFAYPHNRPEKNGIDHTIKKHKEMFKEEDKEDKEDEDEKEDV